MEKYFDKKCLAVFDYHSPFINLELLENQLNLCNDLNFNTVVLGGDISDCYSISRFPTEQNRAEDFCYEVTITKELLQNIRKANQKSHIVFIRGNHEERLQKLLDRNLKQFRNLKELQLESLLGLDKFEIEYKENYYLLNKNFVITHGFRVAKQSAKMELESWGISGCSGHVHKYNMHKTNYDRSISPLPKLEWHSFGTGCDISQMSYAKDFRNKWDNSFGIILYNDTNFLVIPIFPNEKNAFYCPLNGKFYENKRTKKANR